MRARGERCAEPRTDSFVGLDTARHGAACAQIAGIPLADMWFVGFAVVFFVSRLIVFPYGILLSVLYVRAGPWAACAVGKSAR